MQKPSLSQVEEIFTDAEKASNLYQNIMFMSNDKFDNLQSHILSDFERKVYFERIRIEGQALTDRLERMSQKELVVRDVNRFNEDVGYLTNCIHCKNKGFVAETQLDGGKYYLVTKKCPNCREVKKSAWD